MAGASLILDFAPAARGAIAGIEAGFQHIEIIDAPVRAAIRTLPARWRSLWKPMAYWS